MSNATFEKLVDKRISVLVIVLVSAAIGLLYRETIASIVSIWKSDAFAHGFLVFPVCTYLIWRKREALTKLPLSYSSIGVTTLVGLSVLWWVSDFIGIQVIMQLSVIAMVPAAVLATFGVPVAKEIRFALLYLVFAVPFGEFLIPYLIDFTASFSVEALNLFGIPVFADGRFFHVPSGSFEVAKACSGLKYVIATVAMTVLYSHFLFSRLLKSAIFVAFSIILSMVANGFRATVIVLLLHYTDLDIAAGQDHKAIGLIVYVLVVIVLVLVGNRFRDTTNKVEPAKALHDGSNQNTKRATDVVVATMGFLLILGVATGPFLKYSSHRIMAPPIEVTAGLPTSVDYWAAGKFVDNSLRPDYVGYSQMSLGRYTRGNNLVDVAIIRFVNQKQGAEIINETNSVIDSNEWKLGNVERLNIDIRLAGLLTVHQVLASQSGQSRLIWYWTEVDDETVSGALEMKLIQFRHLLAGKPVIATAIVLSTPIVNSAEEEHGLLREFLSVFYFSLQNCMSTEATSLQCSLDAPDVRES